MRHYPQTPDRPILLAKYIQRIAFFVVPCTICQLQSASCPKVLFSPTWNTAILHRFDLDTVHMPEGYGGMNYLLQAIEPAIGWAEGCTSRKNSSELWAKFVFKEIICHFGCIPFFIIDGGTEFKGMVKFLFKQYGIIAIMAMPYSPCNKSVAECVHPTLYESLFHVCGTDKSKWPLFLHACLLAMHCMTSHVTGFPPYYLLYGRSLLLAFDISDRTWDTLDWHTIHLTADLIAIHAQQIVRWDQHLVQGLAEQKCMRQQAVDNFNQKHHAKLSSGEFEVGTWVVTHETWLDSQNGEQGHVAMDWAF